MTQQPDEPPSQHPLVAAYEAARDAILAHCGYVDDWRLFPLDDSTDHYWHVDPGEREKISYSPDRAQLVTYLVDETEGDALYEDSIFTYRHLRHWVFRGQELTIVLADTQTDGNVLLRVLRNDREVRDAGRPGTGEEVKS